MELHFIRYIFILKETKRTIDLGKNTLLLGTLSYQYPKLNINVKNWDKNFAAVPLQLFIILRLVFFLFFGYGFLVNTNFPSNRDKYKKYRFIQNRFLSVSQKLLFSIYLS